MRTWSVMLTAEAVLCAGAQTLAAPVLLLALAAPMPASGAALSLLLVLTAFTALLAYWLLAVPTIERRAYRFGMIYWAGVVSAAVFIVLVSSLARWEFWAVVVTPLAVSGLHFSCLQRRIFAKERAA